MDISVKSVKLELNRTLNNRLLLKKKDGTYYFADYALRISPSHKGFIQQKSSIYGEYKAFLAQFESLSAPDLVDSLDLGELLESTPIDFVDDHANVLNHFDNHHDELNTFATEIVTFVAESVLCRLNTLIDQIWDEKGKNSGSANKRRCRLLKQYKQALGDFRLLVTSTRQSVSSIMRLRLDIQTHIDDEIKWIDTGKKTISYESVEHKADMVCLTHVLNSDLNAAKQCYDAVQKYLPFCDELVEDFNEAMN